MKTKEEKRKYAKHYRHTHGEQLRLKSREYQRKLRAGLGAEGVSARNRRFTEQRKRLILTHYGNGHCACVKCGESRLACLSIDHIKAIGASGRGITGGTNFYTWLIKSNYPDGYQTLCMNCQWIKRYENKEYKIM